MTVSYDKLWKLLKINKMKKSDLAKAAELSSYTMTKLNQDKLVSMEIIRDIISWLIVNIGATWSFIDWITSPI